ncbi:MAG: acylphosphatase [Pseudomonadales bacterium]|jgi:acylphosphatase|nr:acylphosphatase [Pseudomonadales bacterium]
MESVTVRGRVAGRVQGVFFRASLQDRANALGLAGWVRNLDDGSVQFLAHGPEDAVDALLAWAEQGPPAARVDALEHRRVAERPDGEGFEVRRDGSAAEDPP